MHARKAGGLSVARTVASTSSTSDTPRVARPYVSECEECGWQSLERAPQIANAMALVIEEFHEGQNEILGLVEAGENFVLGHRDRVGACHPPFDLDEPETPRDGTTLDLVPETVKLPVLGIEPKAALDV